MWRLLSVFSLFYVLLLCSSAVSRSSERKWQTLSGDAPLVIARGGFSGLFPDSSSFAYGWAVLTGSPNLHAWCDVQLTSDGAGICFPDIMLQNGSVIGDVYRKRSNTYTVNGVQMRGWFSVDFTLNDLASVPLKQRIYSRSQRFDDPRLRIMTVDDVVIQEKPPKLWLNVPYDAFFSQHNQSMRSFIISLSRRVIVNYISSPEVNFLSSIVTRFRKSPTKLVFRFLGHNDVEPSTNQTYGTLLKNLTVIRTFASGILVPKYYIWPVDNSNYLQNYTSLVLDAHNSGLEVFATDFANDAGSLPHDYSFDPVAEYLAYIDNGVFSVDGVLSDFPLTASATIDCFSHMGKNDKVQAKVLIITSEGASGTYPGCTDKAYKKSVADGADIIDCPVQMTSDGIPFCLGSINLRDRTDVVQSNFSKLAIDNPDLGIHNGIFAYNLTWSQIQSLRPAIVIPYPGTGLFRNPRARNDGKLMRLSDFLAVANNASSVSGILLGIENATYLASKQGLGVTDAVLDALSKAGYNNRKAKTVMIQSSESAVLQKIKRSCNYELVYLVDEDVRDILNSTILDIKKFATSVVVSKKSVLPSDAGYTTGETKVVQKLQAFGLPVYVQLFRNEFMSQPWDFFADAYMEINEHVTYMGVNGVITGYPATAAKYRRNRCLGYKERPIYMSAVQPGSLLQLMVPDALPPAHAPNPILEDGDVVEPPLPPVRERAPTQTLGSDTSPTPQNGQSTVVASTILNSIPLLLAVLML